MRPGCVCGAWVTVSVCLQVGVCVWSWLRGRLGLSLVRCGLAVGDRLHGSPQGREGSPPGRGRAGPAAVGDAGAAPSGARTSPRRGEESQAGAAGSRTPKGRRQAGRSGDRVRHWEFSKVLK